MLPVSPREHEVSPSRCSLSPPAELAVYSKNRLLNERVQNSVSRNYNIIPDLCVFFNANRTVVITATYSNNMHILIVCLQVC